jgi:hypothetical protein
MEAVTQSERVAANTREVRVYKMTPDGEKGALKKTIGAEEARALVEKADPVKKTKVTYDIWQPGVEVTELPLADARELWDRNQRFIRTEAAGLESRQLDYDVLTGQTKSQEEYIKGILADNRSGISAEALDSYAAMIADDAKAAGRELTDQELDNVALVQARAAVRRQNPEGLPENVRGELLQRFADIRKRTTILDEKYGLEGAQAKLTANAMQDEVERILDKQGDLTLDELKFLANQISVAAGGSCAGSGCRTCSPTTTSPSSVTCSPSSTATTVVASSSPTSSKNRTWPRRCSRR